MYYTAVNTIFVGGFICFSTFICVLLWRMCFDNGIISIATSGPLSPTAFLDISRYTRYFLVYFYILLPVSYKKYNMTHDTIKEKHSYTEFKY